MGDLISRKALCEYALNQKDKSVTPNDIMRFPSAQPERKTGKWITKEENYIKQTYCSECGSYAPFVFVSDDRFGYRTHGETRRTKFCPECGAKMEGEG